MFHGPSQSLPDSQLQSAVVLDPFPPWHWRQNPAWTAGPQLSAVVCEVRTQAEPGLLGKQLKIKSSSSKKQLSC